ncbi:cell surface glycoprotein 1-like isoform X2 [Osmerus eperlanus]|uniref:cell surface glycoprotein 1-like isoform X2 n=1 Tax=Osmerus eperlanus TaxID=29151 RepID=UPI002E0E94D0
MATPTIRPRTKYMVKSLTTDLPASAKDPEENKFSLSGRSQSVNQERLLPACSPDPGSQPQSSPAPAFQPQSSPAPAFQPQSSPAPAFQPQSSPDPGSQPQSSPAPAFQPQSSPDPGSQPQSSPAPAFQPQSSPAPAFQPQSSPAPAFQPQSSPAPAFQPQSSPDPGSQPQSRAPSPALTETSTESDHQNIPEDPRPPGPVYPPPLRPKTVPSFKNTSSATIGDCGQLKMSNEQDMKSSDACGVQQSSDSCGVQQSSDACGVQQSSDACGVQQSSDACGARSPSPLPPLRPELRPPLPRSCSTPSQLPYERTLPQTECSPQTRPLRPAHPPPGPHKADSLDSTFDEMRTTSGMPSDTSHGRPPRSPRPPLPALPPSPSLLRPPRPALPPSPSLLRPPRPALPPSPSLSRPPRPALPPSPSLSRCPSVYEAPPLLTESLLEDSGGFLYPARPAPPVPISTVSSPVHDQAGYDSPSKTQTSRTQTSRTQTSRTQTSRTQTRTEKPANARGNYTSVRPVIPPPPLFNPPPPPASSRLLLQCPPAMDQTYHTESVYSEIDDSPYLHVLSEENDLQPSSSVYRSTIGSTTQHLQSQPRSRYQNRGVSPCPAVSENTEDFESLLRWMRTMGNREIIPPLLYGVSIEQEIREVNQRALHLKKAFRLFNYLLIKRSDALRSHISDLNSLADCLVKVQKKTQTMGIAGGTVGAVGGVTAIVGIALAPMTMGASLIATAVGAGMVVSAGGMGAKAAQASRKGSMVDRARVEKVVWRYKADITDMEHCLSFILAGVDVLRRHNVTRLQSAGAEPEALRLATLAHTLTPGSTHTSGSSDTLFQMFRKDMDQYFVGKDGQRLKRGTETTFSCQLRLFAHGLQAQLDEMCSVWERLTFLASV